MKRTTRLGIALAATMALGAIASTAPAMAANSLYNQAMPTPNVMTSKLETGQVASMFLAANSDHYIGDNSGLVVRYGGQPALGTSVNKSMFPMTATIKIENTGKVGQVKDGDSFALEALNNIDKVGASMHTGWVAHTAVGLLKAGSSGVFDGGTLQLGSAS